MEWTKPVVFVVGACVPVERTVQEDQSEQGRADSRKTLENGNSVC